MQRMQYRDLNSRVREEGRRRGLEEDLGAAEPWKGRLDFRRRWSRIHPRRSQQNRPSQRPPPKPSSFRSPARKGAEERNQTPDLGKFGPFDFDGAASAEPSPNGAPAPRGSARISCETPSSSFTGQRSVPARWRDLEAPGSPLSILFGQRSALLSTQVLLTSGWRPAPHRPGGGGWGPQGAGRSNPSPVPARIRSFSSSRPGSFLFESVDHRFHSVGRVHVGITLKVSNLNDEFASLLCSPRCLRSRRASPPTRLQQLVFGTSNTSSQLSASRQSPISSSGSLHHHRTLALPRALPPKRR